MQKKQGFRENAEFFAAKRQKPRQRYPQDTWVFLQLFATR
jgi:hypothetical protein